MSVETYGAHEFRLYFVAESVYGVTPTSPTMLGINAEAVEPGIDSGLIKVRGVGSRDLQTIKKGLQRVLLKIPDCLSSESPISFIQHAQTLTSLSIEAIYYKSLWATPSNILSFTYKGMRIDKLTVQCNLEDLIKANVELIGKSFSLGTAKIAGASYGDYAGAVAFNEIGVSRGAADGSTQVTTTKVTDWKWTLENNLKPVPCIQSPPSTSSLIKYLRERHRNLYGEITFEFEDDTEFDDMVSDNEFSLKFDLGPASSALFKYCKWDTVATPTRIEDLVSVKVKFTARDVVIS